MFVLALSTLRDTTSTSAIFASMQEMPPPGTSDARGCVIPPYLWEGWTAMGPGGGGVDLRARRTIGWDAPLVLCHTCDFCPKRFETLVGLQKHRRIVLLPKSFSCPE